MVVLIILFFKFSKVGSLLYQCYVRFSSLKREKLFERADWNFGMGARGWIYHREWWVRQIKLLKALRAVAVKWVCGG